MNILEKGEIFTLISLNKPMYKSEIALKTKMTFSHIIKLLKKLQDLKLITIKTHGRKKIITLTKRGTKVQEHLIKAFQTQ